MKTRLLQAEFVAVLCLLLAVGLCPPAVADDQLRIALGEKEGWPLVTLENSVFEVIIGLNPGGGVYGNEHAIRDLVIKSVGQDQVTRFIDACAQRAPLKYATVIADGLDCRTVRLEYAGAEETAPMAVSEMTIFPHSPVIRIHYTKYPRWTNTVDISDTSPFFWMLIITLAGVIHSCFSYFFQDR